MARANDYNINALFYQEQVVILDTTNAGSTSGSLVVKGGISGRDTYITGHVAVNNVKITPNKNDIIYEQQATLNVTEEYTNITDFYFDNAVANSFKAIINVNVNAGISKYALWEINGVYKPSGWVITSSFTGEITGVNFKIANINGRGQIQYLNPNSGATTTIRYRATTTAPPGSTPLGEGSGIINNTSGPYIANRLLYSNSPDTIANTDIEYNSNIFAIGGNSRILARNANSFTNFSNGGGITSMGDASIAKKLIVGEKVGIVNTAPQFSLDVAGDINFTGNFYKNGGLYSGSSIWDTNAQSDIYTLQNLGIGTTDPSHKLEVTGNAFISQGLTAASFSVTNETATNITSGTLNVSGLTAGNINFTGSLYQNGAPYLGSQWTSGSAGNLSYSGGNVGINTTSPTSTLDVNGKLTATDISSTNTTIATLNVTGLTAGNINFTGSLYKNGAPYVSSQWTSGQDAALTYSGFVGINTTAPGAELEVQGSLRVSTGITTGNLKATGLSTLTNIAATNSTLGSVNALGATMGGHLVPSTNITYNLGSPELRWNDLYLSGNTIHLGEKQLSLANGALNVEGIKITSTENSTSISSGAFVVGGGIGASGNVNISGTVAASSVSSGSVQTANANVTNISAGTLTLSNGMSSGNAYIANFSSSTMNSNLIAATTITGGSLSLSGDIFVAGTLTAVNITTTNLMDTNLTAGIAHITSNLSAVGNSNTVGAIITTGGNVGVGIANPTAKLDVSGTIKSTDLTVTNVTTSTLNASGLTSANAQITNAVSTNITSGTLNLSTGITSASAQITNAAVTTATIATLLNTNAVSTNVSSATLTLSTGLTSVNANVTTSTIATLLNTNMVSTNVSGATLTLSTGLTSASAQITNANVTTATVPTLLNTNAVSTNITSSTLTLSTGLTSASAQITNAAATTATIATLLNTNAVSTNISSATLTLSTGVTSASANITTATVATLLNTNAVSTNITTSTLVANTAFINGGIYPSLNTTSPSNFLMNVFGGILSINGPTNFSGYDISGINVAHVTTLTSNNILVTTQTAATLRVTSNLISLGNSNTLGNLFTTAGNVGIGTTSPGEMLDVRGNLRIGASTQANYISFNGTFNDSTGHTYIGERIFGGTENSELLIFKGNDTIDRIRLLAGEHRFDTFSGNVSGTFEGVGTSGSTSRMIITNSGNVGIGTSTPTYILEAVGRSLMRNAGPGTSGALLLDDQNKGIMYSGNNNSVNTYFEGLFPTDGIAVFGWSDGALGTRQNGNKIALSWNTRGNVGIGTTAPAFALDVTGSGRFTGDVTTGNLEVVGLTDTLNLTVTNGTISSIQITNENVTTSTINTLLMTGNITHRISSTTGSLYSHYVQGTGDNVRGLIGLDGSGYSGLTTGSFSISTWTAHPINFFTNQTNRMTISSGGNVGIGTTAPASRLDINGGAASTPSVIINSSGADSTLSLKNTGTGGREYWIGSASTGAGAGNGNLYFHDSTAGVTRMVLGSTGNFGIGTISPNTKLEIYDASNPKIYVNNGTNRGFFSLFTGNLDIGCDLGSTPIRFMPDGSTRMTIQTNGNVGIGNASPAFNLDVTGSGRFTGGVTMGNLEVTGLTDTLNLTVTNGTMSSLVLNNTPRPLVIGGDASVLPHSAYIANTSGYLEMGIASGAGSYSTSALGGDGVIRSNKNLILQASGAGASHMLIATSGNIGIGITSPGYALHVSGDVYATSDVISFSDVRLKSNITTIENALSKVKNLRGVYYNLNGNNDRKMGVIAQEVEEVIPEVVTNGWVYKGVSYGNMVGILIEAVKDLSKIVDESKQEIETLKQRLNQ